MSKPPEHALLVTWRGPVQADWVDYNGHLRDAFYLLIFSLATDALMDRIGLDAPGRAATGHTLYTLETHLNYQQEAKEGMAVEVRTQLLGMDAKRLHLFHTLHRQLDGEVLATNEQMQINVDHASGRSAPFAPGVQSALAAMMQAQHGLPRPANAGRAIALPGPKSPMPPPTQAPLHG